MVGHEAQNPIKSVRTAFAVIEALKDEDGATVAQLATRLDEPTSTVHNYLSTLREIGYVTKDDSGYHLGFRFCHLGDYAKYRFNLSRVAEPMMEELAATTGGTVNLIVEEYGRGVYVLVETSDRHLRNYSYARHREYLHCTAAGKAILAHLDPSTVEAILDTHGLPKRTNATITDPDRLSEELDTVRDRGYATNDGESVDGLRAIGAPIQYDEHSYAAISVSDSRSSFDDDVFQEKLPEEVRQTARAIELDIAH